MPKRFEDIDANSEHWAAAFRKAVHVDIDDDELAAWFSSAIRCGAALGLDKAVSPPKVPKFPKGVVPNDWAHDFLRQWDGRTLGLDELRDWFGAAINAGRLYEYRQLECSLERSGWKPPPPDHPSRRRKPIIDYDWKRPPEIEPAPKKPRAPKAT